MIISDTYRFAFLHIPKCAGTSVRRALTPYNQWSQAGPPWTKEHPDLGLLDYGHIPLFVLRDHFPGAFRSVMDYWSFGVIRNPYDRFASSVSQRMTISSSAPLRHRSLREYKAALSQSIDYLSRYPDQRHLLPPDYIHFQRQVDYTTLDEKAAITAIYTIDTIDQLLHDVAKRIGDDLDEQNPISPAPGRENAAMVFRSEALRRGYRYASPLLRVFRCLLPAHARQAIRQSLYVSRDQRTHELFASDYVKDFVRSYYAQDLNLYARIREQQAAEKGP